MPQGKKWCNQDLDNDRLILWCWMICLGNKLRSFCLFLRLHPSTAFRTLLFTMRAILFLNPEYLLKGLMLKLKLQYFDHLIRRANSFKKTLMLGKTEGRKRRGRQTMRWLDGITAWIWVWASSVRWWKTGKSGVLQSMGSQRVRHNWTTELTKSLAQSLRWIVLLCGH